MKRLLRKSEYIDFAPDSVGIVRANHESDYCHGDSASMLVERKEDGSVAAHCFRCGSGGFTPAKLRHKTTEEIRANARRRHGGTESQDSRFGNLVVGGIGLPESATGEVVEFSADARLWLSEAGLTDAWLTQENFLWDEESQCLYIPVRQETNLVGYVQRYFAPKDYRTLALDKSNFFGYYRKEVDKLTDSVVIVEDVLSALRVSKFSDTIAVLGTNLPPQAVSLILRRYANVTIFLDADNPTVKRETRRMARKLPFVKVRLIETGKDPKRYSDEALKSLLTTE